MQPRPSSRWLASLALAVTALAAPAAAQAGRTAGVTMADRLQLGKSVLVLNGMGIRKATIFKVKVYVAGLYLERPSSNPQAILDTDQPRVIHLHFVRDVDRGDIVKAFREGFKKNSGPRLSAIESRIQRLLLWTPKFADGDTLTFRYQPGFGTEVMVNGRSKGVIPGADFGRAVFALFLGPKPPDSGLKRGLLGHH